MEIGSAERRSLADTQPEAQKLRPSGEQRGLRLEVNSQPASASLGPTPLLGTSLVGDVFATFRDVTRFIVRHLKAKEQHTKGHSHGLPSA